MIFCQLPDRSLFRYRTSVKLPSILAVLGCQWGDEGKGKLVDIIALKYHAILRATGGANAGHTVYIPNPKKRGTTLRFIFHQIPSGVLHKKTSAIIGNGCVIHLPTLFDEINFLKKHGIGLKGRLFISDRAHLVFEYHKTIDALWEVLKGGSAIGTTKRGIGPAYTDKMARIGIRVGDLLDFEKFRGQYLQTLDALKKMFGFPYEPEHELTKYREYAHLLKPFITDTSQLIHEFLHKKKPLLIEGANGALLDIDHGTYPYVTSSNASVGGMISGLGIPPQKLTDVLGVVKAYTTRVGAGPFPTELTDELGVRLREDGGEYGSTTGRPRRCGWFDAVCAKYALSLNGATMINLTKLDVLSNFPSLQIGVAYRYKGKKLNAFPSSLDVLQNVTVDYIKVPGWQKNIEHVKTFTGLPKAAQKYVQTLEKLLDCPIRFIGVGKLRSQMIVR